MIGIKVTRTEGNDKYGIMVLEMALADVPREGCGGRWYETGTRQCTVVEGLGLERIVN